MPHACVQKHTLARWLNLVWRPSLVLSADRCSPVMDLGSTAQTARCGVQQYRYTGKNMEQTDGSPPHLKTGQQPIADCLSHEEGLVQFGRTSLSLLDMSSRHICLRNKNQTCHMVVDRQTVCASIELTLRKLEPQAETRLFCLVNVWFVTRQRRIGKSNCLEFKPHFLQLWRRLRPWSGYGRCCVWASTSAS